MRLSDIVLTQDKEVVALIGSGGKTTVLRILARENRNNKRVLLSSTVNMERVPEEELDFVDYEYRQDYSLCLTQGAGVALLAYELEPNNSLRAIAVSTLEEKSSCFDLTVAECDESRQRPLKAWRSMEPILPKSTTITLGLLDLSCLGEPVSVDYIHNLDVFCDITGKTPEQVITRQDVLTMVLHKDMMFGKALGKKILFINKIEDEMTLQYARNLSREILRSTNRPDFIIIGSAHRLDYEVIGDTK